MSTSHPPTLAPQENADQKFSAVQKEFLQGFFAALAQRQLHAPPAQSSDAAPAPGSLDATSIEPKIFGTPLSDATKQERWKYEEHPLDSWDRLLAHADAEKFPDDENTFRFRYFGMFYVAPAQNSFMLRCRIPAGELTANQLSGLAGIADEFGDGKAAITTRSNIQIRQIAPKNLVNVLTRLQSLGLTSKGSGVDNVRNITASPTAGFDPQEFIDTRPFAHALHHYILNHRDLYNLPRKFNIAFEGGGSVDTVADSNDIGFMAVRLGVAADGASIPDQKTLSLEPGTYFRVELAGISGHKQLAIDSGLLVKPADSVAVAVAMLRVFIENGNRSDRKKARLKYLIDEWGIDRFVEETQKKLGFPLVRLPIEKCGKRPPALKHGHLGVYRQKQRGKNYVGVLVPVGILTTKQMRRLADLAQHYGSGQLRLTPWQNLLIPDVADGFVETVKRALPRIGLHFEATHGAGGLIACTGNQGCKYAATDTKGHALALAAQLNKHVPLDQPVNIHFTGCPHSCAQHYIGDIGLQGVKVNIGGASVEGYHIVFGGGTGADAGIAKEVFSGISFCEVPALIERVLQVYLERRKAGESFANFSRRHSVKELQEMFSS
jgi:ferredoxin-nitrite reductase